MTVTPAADRIVLVEMEDPTKPRSIAIQGDGNSGTIVRLQSLPVSVPKPSTSGGRSLAAQKRCPSAVEQDAQYSCSGTVRISPARGACPPTAGLESCSTSGATQQKLFSLFQPATEFERKMLGVVRDLALECSYRASSVCNVDLLGSKLKQKGYQVWVRTTIGGGSEWFKQLQHSFLLVEGDPNFPEQLYVVDPNFRDQFVIARQTAQYQRVMQSVPQVFVGRGKKLLPAVQLLCAEMSAAFSQQQLEVPPWRKNKSIMSKWMPQKKKDYVPEPLTC